MRAGPGFPSGIPACDAAIAAQTVELVADRESMFPGLTAAERLDRARAALDVVVPLSSAMAARDLGTPIACSSGCSACCIYSKVVSALPLEVERILDRVEREGRLEEVVGRADARQARGKGACPLLGRDGRCTVYEDRPLSCRRYHSTDRAACESGERPIVPWIGILVSAGMALTELARGPSGKIVDLYEAIAPMARARPRRALKQQKCARAGQ